MEWYIKVLKNYANFSGRARRKEYWMFFLINIIISIIIGIVDGLLGLEFSPDQGILGTIYSLGLIVPSIAVAVRRMHDVNKSGWFCLIPIYNFVLAVTEGDNGSNKYGPDPKNENSLSGDDDILDSHLLED